jgi:NADH-quinone oxidoreductase subunit B
MPDSASLLPPGEAKNPGGAGAPTSTRDRILAWARDAARRPVILGLACCSVEMIPGPGPRYELPPRVTAPEASDVLVVAGTVSEKMAPWLLHLWDQMPQPKWAVAVGACSCCGGPFATYAVTQGVDRILPIDVYIPGCPPSAEALLEGLLRLEQKIARQMSRK